MKNFIVLVEISLDANGEYFSSISDVYFGRVTADTAELALEKAKETITPEMIKGRCDFARGYDFYIRVEEI